jgi:hypothetical protein
VFDKLAAHVPLWKEIQLEVCAKHGVDLAKEIYADRRLRKYTLARQEIFYRLRYDAKMSLMDFAEFQSMPDELKKLYYSTMTMVAPEAMKTVKADDIKRPADNAMIQIKRAQLPGVNAVPILMPAPTVQWTVDGWKGPMEAVTTTSAPAPKTAPAMPAAPATAAKSETPVADAKKGLKYLWILLAILVILAGGYAKYKYF